MAITISIGIQKGGCGKTTSAGIIAYLLAEEGNKVLAVDLDSQGNLTEFMTLCDIYDFHGETVLEALKAGDVTNYIHQLNEHQNIHILTAEDMMATFSRWLYTEYKKNPSIVLKNALEPVQDQYDYIIIDTPPALGDATINAMIASDYIVVMFETSKFCYSALPRFIETVELVQEELNPNLKIAGILRSLVDSRRADNKSFIEIIDEEYGEFVFDTIIKRKASTGRIAFDGFFDNPELKKAIDPYKPFLKELKQRVHER